jgi:outer membrane protein insertion porin family
LEKILKQQYTRIRIYLPKTTGMLLMAILFGLAVVQAAAGTAALQDGQTVRLEDISVRVKDPYTSDFDWDSMVRAVIDLNPGDLLTNVNLERTKAALTSFGQVETLLDRGRLVFTLSPFKRIKSITISDHYPLFEQEVRDVMTIRLGTNFNPDDIPEQVALISRRYKTEGYIDPQVRINWQQDEDDGHYHVSVKIEKGRFFRVGQLNITGNQAFAESLLKAKMSSWRSYALWAGRGRFAQYKLKQDIEKLLQYYRKQGFADTDVAYTLSPDIGNRLVNIDVAIEEGPQYHITFAGNTEFYDYTLNKDLDLFTTGNRGNIGLRRSVQNIRRRYLRKGYVDVLVRWKEIDTPSVEQNRRSIQIEIDEGLCHIVRSIVIKGQHYFDEERIRKQMLTRPASGYGDGAFDAKVLQEDLSSIQALYLKRGFINAQLSETVDIHPTDKTVKVTISILEGQRTRVGRITFEGDMPVSSENLSAELQLVSGEPYEPYLVRGEESKLAARIAPYGYPHVHVEATTTLSDDQKLAHIVYKITPGPYVQVGSIFLAGNFRTRDDILMRELAFSTGDPFSLAKVLAAQRNLRGLGQFESVQVRTIGLKERDSTVHLLILTVEKKPYFFELGGGYESTKGAYARSKIGDRNFLGADKEIWAGGEVAQTGFRLDAGLSNPRLFGTRMRADIGGFLEHEEKFNQDFGTDTAGSTLNISRRWSRQITSSLGWRYEWRKQFLRNQDALQEIEPKTLESRSNLVTTPAIVYDSRDSFIRPRRGWFSNLSMGWSQGLDNDLDDFIRYRADLRVYHSFRPELTLAATARMGYLAAFGDNAQIPQDQLFFLGGTLDVRGYKENLLQFDETSNPVGGRLALSTSIEARYDIGGNFEVATFVDAGRLQLLSDETSDEDWRWSVGLGLRYMTPIGPIGLLYGHKIDPRPGERKGQFHFTMGYTF